MNFIYLPIIEINISVMKLGGKKNESTHEILTWKLFQCSLIGARSHHNLVYFWIGIRVELTGQILIVV